MDYDLKDYESVLSAIGTYSANLATELMNMEHCGLVATPGEDFTGTQWKEAQDKLKKEYRKLAYKALLWFKAIDKHNADKETEARFRLWQQTEETNDGLYSQYVDAEDAYSDITNEVSEISKFIRDKYGEEIDTED